MREHPGGPRAGEARLDQLREEAGRTGRVAAPGVRAVGGPVAAAGLAPDHRDGPGYHALPVLKPPVWTWEIPLYFFIGGLAGMTTVIALGAHLTDPAGYQALVRRCLWIATGGTLASVALLISDLGRPGRFLNMLRILKPRSAMSVGAWGLNAFGAMVTLGAVIATWGGGSRLEPLLLPVLVVAATCGGLVGTYTGVLLATTAIPAWHTHRMLLPLHFGIAGLGSAAALLELTGFRIDPLHRVGLACAAAETLVGAWAELHRKGAATRPLHEGRSGLLLRASGAVTGPVSLGLRLLGWRGAAAVAFLIGALVSRFGWLEAGRASARDPEAALAASD